MRKSYLNFSIPDITQKEIDEVVKTLKSGWLTTGKKTQLFEKNFANYTGAKYAIALSSCTAALFLSLIVEGIQAGDEVITTPFTFVSTANVVHHLGAKPVFVDIEPDTYNIDPEKIPLAITSKTKAIIPVHYSGQPCNMQRIMKIAADHNLRVIEDAAHAIGAEYQGKKVGGQGNLTCFSFFPTKNITTGEGGIITLNDKEKAIRLKKLRLHGMSKDGWKRYDQAESWYYEIHEAGYKFNLSDINAALGVIQLGRIKEINQKRKELADYYIQELTHIPGIQTLSIPSNVKSSWHIFPIWIDSKELGLTRNQLIKALWKRNIGTSVHFIPLHLQPFYQKEYQYKKGDFPVVEKIFAGIVSLPLFPKMTNKDIDDVINAIQDAVK